MVNGARPGVRPALLAEELVPPLVELFTTAWALDTRMRELAGPLAPGKIDNERLLAAFSDAEVRSLRLKLPRLIESIEPLVDQLPQSVFDCVAAVARVRRATLTVAPMPDYVLVVLRNKLGEVAAMGSRAVQCAREKYAGVCTWAGDASKEASVIAMLGIASQPGTCATQCKDSDSALSLLDRFPATTEGHVAFLEFVHDEVRLAAEAKRRQLELGYGNDTIESMVRGVKWEEALARLEQLPDLPDNVVADLRSVLKCDLTTGTVEAIDERLRPAVAALRYAWDNGRSAFSPSAADMSLVELLNQVVRRLQLKPDLLRACVWDHPGTLNVSGVNAAAKSLGLGPIMLVGEAADWARAPNLPADDPVNTRKVDRLTVFHPDGSEYRIRRTGGMLDDSSGLPTAEVTARLGAWIQHAQIPPPTGNHNCSDNVKAAPQNALPGATSPTPAEAVGSAMGFLGGAMLADALEIHSTRRDAFFRQLERQRASLGDDCWHEVREPRPNSPRFLYRANSPKLRDLAARYMTPKPA